jgi:hypothetical protein
LSVAHKSLSLGGLVHGEYCNNTNDQLPNISHDDDHVQPYIVKGMVYSESESDLRDLFFKLKQIFEGTFEQIGENIASVTPNVVYREPIRPSTAKEKTLVVSTNISALSTSPSLDSIKDISAFIKKCRMSQGMFRSTEREAKERKLEEKKAYLLEIKDVELVGPNVAR